MVATVAMQKWCINTFATEKKQKHMFNYISSTQADALLTKKNSAAIRSYVKKFLSRKNYRNPNFYDNDLIIDGAVNHVTEQVIKSKYDPSISPFLPWAFTVAVNYAITKMRQYSKCAMGMAESYDRGYNDGCDDMDADSTATLDFPCDDDPLENLEFSNAIELYNDLAKSYNEKMRGVAEMLLEGCPRDEIKETLGISDNELSIYKCRIKKNFISRLRELSSYHATA